MLMEPLQGLGLPNPPPKSNNTVRVRVIDTTARFSLHAFSFLDPVMPGHERLSVTTWSFLIENERMGKKALFDLGPRKDYWNLPPFTLRRIQTAIPSIAIEKDVPEILQEHGIELSEINDIIWSHSHWDHMGRPELFPSSTNLCYGKGTGPFPTYPTNPDSNLCANDFKDRKCVEIDCSNQLKIGPFSAHDFHGDGSLYLLDTPGHVDGHLCALARTTPDTFVFLGGDISHFPGHFRPSEWIPLPSEIPDVALRGQQHKYPSPCMCHFFTDHHPQQLHPEETEKETADVRRTPFYRLPSHQRSTYKYPATAIATAHGMEKYFDSDPNIIVLLAHDPTLLDFVPLFNTHPDQDINDWKARGLKEKCHWAWLGELPQYDREHKLRGQGFRDVQIVEGWWKNGKRVESLEE